MKRDVISVTLKTGEKKVLKLNWCDEVVEHLETKHDVDIEKEMRDMLFTMIPRVLEDEGVFIRDIVSINLQEKGE